MSHGNAEKLLQSLQPKQRAQPAAKSDNAAVGDYVIRNLGRPSNLVAVQIRRLWEDHYRVNILVGENAASVTIPHSYFLVMGSDGSCLSSNPAIKREYQHKKIATASVACKGGEKDTSHVHAADVD